MDDRISIAKHALRDCVERTVGAKDQSVVSHHIAAYVAAVVRAEREKARLQVEALTKMMELRDRFEAVMR